MVSSWISQIISLIGTYISWLFTLYIADGVTVGSSILFFAIATLVIIFIKRLAHAGSFQQSRKESKENG